MYTSNTRNKSGDDCKELDADWVTVCQLFLEIYDTHYYHTQKQNDFDWPTEVMAQSAVAVSLLLPQLPSNLRLGSFAVGPKSQGTSIIQYRI